jgi:hypothetical protein
LRVSTGATAAFETLIHSYEENGRSNLTRKYTIGAVVMGKMKKNKDMGATKD